MAANFSQLSSPESNDSAVDTLISQAIDLSVLEQIAALNTSHLSDSSLPSDLESRFRKLNSFPGANPQPRSPPRCIDPVKEKIPRSLNRCRSGPNLSIDAKPDEPMKPEDHSPSRAGDESEITPPAKKDGSKNSEPKLGSGFASSPSISLNSSRESPSPPRQVCCFGCSPKRVSKKRGKGDGVLGFGLDAEDWGKNDEILSDLTTFSLKDQQRKLKKALKEQEKASREAEKVVKWVKQASARMDVSKIDELLSDDDIFK